MRTTDTESVSPALDEAEYLALWLGHELFLAAPGDAAYEGGLLADRPAWVFVAGYQAAIRTVFPEVEVAGWLAFAVSEDRDDPDSHPPLIARAEESEWLLSGSKSWVAQSQSVSELLVTARLRERTEIFRVSAQIKGLTLSHRQSPGFLGAMSQGYATFDESPAARLDAPQRRKQFAAIEAIAMMIATAGYLQRISPESATARDALAQITACAAELRVLMQDPKNIDPIELCAVDERFHQAFEAWKGATDTADLADFDADQSLFRLYRRGIAKRAEAATIRVSEAD
ncbi:MAG: hypothetical protein ACR2PZ_25335 [Pseudomonadales bacterium]